jgi:hypothetical protein
MFFLMLILVMSRPEIIIDTKELTELMAFCPSLEETACWFNCSPDTVERRIKSEWGLSFAEFRHQKSGKTRLMLKRKAIRMALEDDNDKMLIYCLRAITDLNDRTSTLSYEDTTLVFEDPTENKIQLCYKLEEDL